MIQAPAIEPTAMPALAPDDKPLSDASSTGALRDAPERLDASADDVGSNVGPVGRARIVELSDAILLSKVEGASDGVVRSAVPFVGKLVGEAVSVIRDGKVDGAEEEVVVIDVEDEVWLDDDSGLGAVVVLGGRLEVRVDDDDDDDDVLVVVEVAVVNVELGVVSSFATPCSASTACLLSWLFE